MPTAAELARELREYAKKLDEIKPVVKTPYGEGYQLTYGLCRDYMNQAAAFLEAQARVVEAARDFDATRIISAWQSAEMVHAANLLKKALHELDATGGRDEI